MSSWPIIGQKTRHRPFANDANPENQTHGTATADSASSRQMAGFVALVTDPGPTANRLVKEQTIRHTTEFDKIGFPSETCLMSSRKRAFWTFCAMIVGTIAA